MHTLAAKRGIIRGNLRLYHLSLNKRPSLLNVLLELRQASFQKLLLFRRQFSQRENLLDTVDLLTRAHHRQPNVSLQQQ